jgi:hypothetical protein
LNGKLSKRNDSSINLTGFGNLSDLFKQSTIVLTAESMGQKRTSMGHNNNPLTYKHEIPRLNGKGRLTTPSYDLPEVVRDDKHL